MSNWQLDQYVGRPYAMLDADEELTISGSPGYYPVVAYGADGELMVVGVCGADEDGYEIVNIVDGQIVREPGACDAAVADA